MIGFVLWFRTRGDESLQDTEGLIMARPVLHITIGAAMGMLAAALVGLFLESNLTLRTSVAIQPLQPDVFIVGGKVAGDWVFRYQVAGEERTISLSTKDIAVTEDDTAQPRFELYRYTFTNSWYNLVGLPPVNEQFKFVVPVGTIVQEYQKS